MLYVVLKDGSWEYGPDNRVRLMTADGRDLTEQVGTEWMRYLDEIDDMVYRDGGVYLEDGWLVVEASESFCADDFAECLVGDCASVKGWSYMIDDVTDTH